MDALLKDLRFALRQSLVIIIPCTLVVIVLAQPLVGILVKHLDASQSWPVGTVLAVLTAGLPGFTIFQLCVRGLQSMQRARQVFLLYVLDNDGNHVYMDRMDGQAYLNVVTNYVGLIEARQRSVSRSSMAHPPMVPAVAPSGAAPAPRP